MGKLGAFVGVFTFPFFMHWKGLAAAEGAAAIVSLLGLLVTMFLLPETKGKSLEEISADPPPNRLPPDTVIPPSLIRVENSGEGGLLRR